LGHVIKDHDPAGVVGQLTLLLYVAEQLPFGYGNPGVINAERDTVQDKNKKYGFNSVSRSEI